MELAGEERERLTARDVGIVDGVVRRVVVDGDRLRAVELADGQVVLRHAVFVVPGMLPHDGLLTGLGCTKDGDGWVITDALGRTSVPGVWAAGNVADPRTLPTRWVTSPKPPVQGGDSWRPPGVSVGSLPRHPVDILRCPCTTATTLQETTTVEQ